MNLYRQVFPIAQADSSDATDNSRQLFRSCLACALALVAPLLGLLLSELDHYLEWPVAHLMVRFLPIAPFLSVTIVGLAAMGLYLSRQDMSGRQWLVAGLACVISAMLLYFPFHVRDFLYWSNGYINTVFVLIAIVSILPLRLAFMKSSLTAWAMRVLVVYATYLFFLNQMAQPFIHAHFYPWRVVLYEV